MPIFPKQAKRELPALKSKPRDRLNYSQPWYYIDTQKSIPAAASGEQNYITTVYI